MTKEAIAIIGLGLTLIAAVFGFGLRIGTLTERVETQTHQLERLEIEVRAVNQHFIVWAGSHQER